MKISMIEYLHGWRASIPEEGLWNMKVVFNPKSSDFAAEWPWIEIVRWTARSTASQIWIRLDVILCMQYHLKVVRFRTLGPFLDSCWCNFFGFRRCISLKMTVRTGANFPILVAFNFHRFQPPFLNATSTRCKAPTSR